MGRRIAIAGQDRAGAKAEALTRLCVIRPLPEPALAEIDAALTGYLSEAIASVRAGVALRLADCDWAPLEAVRMLAFDEIEIALPVLERSRRLAEADLEALAELDRARRCALARRAEVSERVSARIASKRESECLLLLARNAGARLSDASAADFASVARGAPDLQRTLAGRPDLRPGLARALLAVAGEAVKSAMAERFPDLAPERLDAAVQAAAIAPDAGGDAQSAALVDKLAARRLLGASELLRAADAGRTSMTDHIAARLTGLDVEDWRRALARSPLRAILLCARAAALPGEQAARLHT
ncbi:MAG: DUF2336 domain-containing protein, partial [Oceanicaulis sp.]